MFYEEIRTKQDLSYISICSLNILYNSKFILMATSLGTNAVEGSLYYKLYDCIDAQPDLCQCWMHMSFAKILNGTIMIYFTVVGKILYLCQ